MKNWMICLVCLLGLVLLGDAKYRIAHPDLEGDWQMFALVVDVNGNPVQCDPMDVDPSPVSETMQTIECTAPCWYSLGDEPIDCHELASWEQICSNEPVMHQECGEGMCFYAFNDAKEE